MIRGLSLMGIDLFFLWLVWDRIHPSIVLGIGYTAFLLVVSVCVLGEMD